ncbi:hypothetical protein [Actinomadura sp. 21ATH]|uniref:hypothetical protein n=1 Tax=Actinomadura sp. 21ATH TaxID=1735444 RepID=UPI0035BF8D9F
MRLRHITIDGRGVWRANGRILISSSFAEGLVDCPAVADPGAWRGPAAWAFLSRLPDGGSAA